MLRPTSSTSLRFKDILRTSRPLLWLNTAALWVLGLLVLEQPPTWHDLLLILFFTLPFNLWLHGINDVYDWESDQQNARKGSAEGALLARPLHQPMLRATLAWNLPFWLLALGLTLWRGTWLALGLLTLFVLLGWAYSAPPIRGKNRPFLDSLINGAYILPYTIVLAWHHAPPSAWQASLPAIVAFVAWAVASHAFTSIQDIEADRAAGIATVATWLGAWGSCWYSLLFYALAVLAAARYGWPWAALVAVYPALVAWYMATPSRQRANQLYRTFILLNSLLGFVITTTLALRSPPNTLWAAILVLTLVGVVLAAIGWGRHGVGD